MRETVRSPARPKIATARPSRQWGAIAVILLGGCHGQLVGQADCAKDADCPGGGVCGADFTCSCPLLIADFESGITGFSGCRSGGWYTGNDTTNGVQHPSPSELFAPELLDPPRGSSLHALHMSGGGFTNWGALMGISLHPGTPGDAALNAYDASAYGGVTFYARAPKTFAVVFDISQPKTIDVAFGGTCTTGCNDNYSKTFVPTPDWQSYTFRFGDLAQRGFGTRTTLDLSAISDFHWNVGINVDFDLYIDDVSFVP